MGLSSRTQSRKIPLPWHCVLSKSLHYGRLGVAMHSASPRCTKSTSKLQDTALTVLGSFASFSSYVQRHPIRQHVCFENQATLYGQKLGNYCTEALDIFMLRCIQAQDCHQQLERGAKSSKQAKASRLRDCGLFIHLLRTRGTTIDTVVTTHSKQSGNILGGRR